MVGMVEPQRDGSLVVRVIGLSKSDLPILDDITKRDEVAAGLVQVPANKMYAFTKLGVVGMRESMKATKPFTQSNSMRPKDEALSNNSTHCGNEAPQQQASD